MSDEIIIGSEQSPEERNRAQWLEKRRAGIGGSEAAVLMGCGYISEIELWEQKVFGKEETEEQKEFFEFGNLFEEPIARKYQLKTGRCLLDHGRYDIAFNEKYPFMHCTIDREIVTPRDNPDDPRHGLIPFPEYAEGPGSLSIKNAGWYMSKDWDEEPPLAFQIQIQHELAVKNWKWGSFAVVLGGNTFRWADTQRNDKFIEILVNEEGEFWHKVQQGIRPDPDGSESAKRALLRMHPKDNGQSIMLPVEAYLWSKRLREAKAAEKAAKSEIDFCSEMIKSRIGNATIGYLPDVPTEMLEKLSPDVSRAVLEHPSDVQGLSWKHQDRGSYVVQATEFRVLREEKAKKGKK